MTSEAGATDKAEAATTTKKVEPQLVATPQPDGTHIITWPGVVAPNGGMLFDGTDPIGDVAPGMNAFHDMEVLEPGNYTLTFKPYKDDPVSCKLVIAGPTTPVVVPLPAVTIKGAYSDSFPSGTDAFPNLASLQTALQAVAPSGTTVTLSAVTTYSGGNIAGYTPVNGEPVPAGGKILLALALGNGQAYSSSGTTTLLQQCQALGPAYTALFQRAIALCGVGNLIIRVGYEWNGIWVSTGVYPAGGVGPFVLYPPADRMAAISYVCMLAKQVDITCATDFNVTGDGPNGLLDQWGQPVIASCPMGTMVVNNTMVNIIDIISCDTQVKQWGVGHVTPYIDLAKANGKHWAMPEIVGVITNDGTFGAQDIMNLCLLADGLPAYDRGNLVTYTAFERAFYMSLFSSNDNNGSADLQQAANAPALVQWALGLAVPSAT